MRYVVNAVFKIALLIIFFPPVARSALIENSYRGNWAGIEVIGIDSVTAQKLRKLIPFQKGGDFALADIQKYKSKCQEIIKKNVPNSEGRCSCVLFDDKKVFLVADIFHNDAKSKISLFRTIPKKKHGKISKLPKKLHDPYVSLEEKRSFHLSQGKFPLEIIKDGYLDYEDPTLHALAVQLSKYASEYNDILLDIIHYSKDAEERRTAAILFSWAKHPENIDLILKWNILFDPDTGVRNNIARSYVFVMQDVKNKSLLKKLIPIYCKQVTIPSHTDRNKALTSIFEILQADKEILPIIDKECKATIKYMSEISILNNVGGVAKEIIKLFDDAENA